jgi:hypothetical protein
LNFYKQSVKGFEEKQRTKPAKEKILCPYLAKRK